MTTDRLPMLLRPFGLLARQRPDPDAERTLGQRASDAIARFGGSWTFVLLFLAFMLAWSLINTEVLGPRMRAFDPYPYVFLNLLLSMLAALQAPIIMMSQNRQAERDRIDAKLDFEVNQRAETGIVSLAMQLEALHDTTRERGPTRDEWQALVELQRRQLALLEQLVEGRGASTL